MSRHLEQVLANAENQLASTGLKRPTEVLPLYKKFLKIEEHRLRLKHQAGGGGREICTLRVELVDVLLRHVFAAAVAAAGAKGAPQQPMALIALGGYGRGELNPASDVDVLLLHGATRGKNFSPTWSRLWSKFFTHSGMLASRWGIPPVRSKTRLRRQIATC